MTGNSQDNVTLSHGEDTVAPRAAGAMRAIVSLGVFKLQRWLARRTVKAMHVAPVPRRQKVIRTHLA